MFQAMKQLKFLTWLSATNCYYKSVVVVTLVLGSVGGTTSHKGTPQQRTAAPQSFPSSQHPSGHAPLATMGRVQRVTRGTPAEAMSSSVLTCSNHDRWWLWGWVFISNTIIQNATISITWLVWSNSRSSTTLRQMISLFRPASSSSLLWWWQWFVGQCFDFNQTLVIWLMVMTGLKFTTSG